MPITAHLIAASRVIAVAAFFGVGLTSGLATPGMAQDTSETDTSIQGQQADGPLVVPVVPRLEPGDLPPTVESLKDSYVVMDDGSVITLADWVLGALSKSSPRAGMSDYENRLFLGQVARAAMGLPQDMIHRSHTDPGAPRPFVPHTPPAPLQAAQGLLAMVIPALAPNWSPVVPEPGLSDIANRGNGGTIQFDAQFSEAMFLVNEDFIYEGRLRNMMSVPPEAEPKP